MLSLTDPTRPIRLHISLEEESSRCVILSPVSLLLLSPPQKQQDHDRSAIAVSLLLPLTKLVAQLQLEMGMQLLTMIFLIIFQLSISWDQLRISWDQFLFNIPMK